MVLSIQIGEVTSKAKIIKKVLIDIFLKKLKSKLSAIKINEINEQLNDAVPNVNNKTKFDNNNLL